MLRNDFAETGKNDLVMGTLYAASHLLFGDRKSRAL